MDKGDFQVSHSLEHGLIKVGVRSPLGVKYEECVLPVDTFFAIVGQSLHEVMAGHAQARESLTKSGIRAVPGRIELAKA